MALVELNLNLTLNPSPNLSRPHYMPSPINAPYIYPNVSPLSPSLSSSPCPFQKSMHAERDCHSPQPSLHLCAPTISLTIPQSASRSRAATPAHSAPPSAPSAPPSPSPAPHSHHHHHHPQQQQQQQQQQQHARRASLAPLTLSPTTPSPYTHTPHPHIHTPTPSASQITPRLFLADLSAAEDPALLAALGITHVLSALPGPVHLPPALRLAALQLPLADTPFAELAAHLPRTTRWIADALDERPDARVLVHCAMGVSRSPSVVAAWLMAARGWAPEEAIEYVRGRRAGVCPNEGFVRQLHEYWEVLERERRAAQ